MLLTTFLEGNSGGVRDPWQTAGVVFAADALGAWLVEQLADAGRKKLTELMLGSEQERALRRTADAAVWATAEEMSPSSGTPTGQMAMVISEVFRDPLPAATLAAPAMLLECLHAGIAGQLAVLDDAELTGTGHSSADVLGVPGTILADRLTSHLVREITIRGSGGGPLTPLADQLNHELTRLQGQRIEGMLARLAAEIRDTLARPANDVTMAGWPLDEVTDPFALEVHPPVQAEDAPPGRPLLPPYVPREHDEALGQVVHAVAGGRSAIAVLVGGSSTGKTRACWEALSLLRGLDPPWRLWHPIDPSRPDAALRELAGVGPRTVIWLNEAQYYLAPVSAGLGERVAAGLRALLREPGRAPVLVLATMWPRFWDALTSRPAGGDDVHAQARELLTGHNLTVPTAFTQAQMGQLAGTGDARMALAARLAPDGKVVQFLAGAPELLVRYRNAPAAAAALIHAAMDARRLGMGAALPQAFLEAAAPGYLTDAEWDGLGEDWLEQALAYAAVPCNGARGPLTRIRARPGGHATRDSADKPASMATDAGPLYRLADYLDQHGRAHRASQIPPAEFWSAAAAHAAPGDQGSLGAAAHDRGLYRTAVQLHKNAASGDPRAAFYLSHPPACLREDPRPAHWAAAHAPLDDPEAVITLLDSLREAGAHQQASVLLARDPAAHVHLDDPYAVARLLDRLLDEGANQQAIALARRAAGRVPVDDEYGFASRLLTSLQVAGAHQQLSALADRVAAHAPLNSPEAVATLLYGLLATGAHQQANGLLARDPAAHVNINSPEAVARLLDRLLAADAHEQVSVLLARDPAAHVDLGHQHNRVDRLLGSLRRADAHEQATALADRAAAHAPPRRPACGGQATGQPVGGGRPRAGRHARRPGRRPRPRGRPIRDANHAAGLPARRGSQAQATALADRIAAHALVDAPGWMMATLLKSLREAGAHQQVTAVADRIAAHAPVDDPGAVSYMLDCMREAGAHQQVTALADRAAAHAPLDDPHAVARLLYSLLKAGTHKQVAALLARDPAAHACLDEPSSVSSLLDCLREAGARQQVAALLGRDPAAQVHLDNAAPFDNASAAASLLDSLLDAGAHQQATMLESRLPPAGMFELFLERQGPGDQFRFGREADGTPAAPWGWGDLG